jgi:uncharacterized protein (DUF39 family)
VARVLIEKTNKKKIYLKETIQKHSTNNTKAQYKQYKSTVQTIQNTVYTIINNIKIDIKDLEWNNIALCN